jgi:acyl dehydratase
VSLRWRDVRVGDTLPVMTVDVTATIIVATAIATRDFMPVHHDRDYANQQGAPDIFMNILSDTGFCSRFLTDWGGPDAFVTKLAIRLGVPVFPGTTLVYTGSVTGVAEGDGDRADEGFADIAFRATTAHGEHLSGTATVSLPLG